MKIKVRLMLLVAISALAGVGITALLSYQVSNQRVTRFFLSEDAGRFATENQTGSEARGREERGHYGQQFAREPARLKLLSDLRVATLEAALIALGVALLAGGFFAFRVSRPISNLTSITKRFAQGERALRVKVKGNDELTELARVFNETADQLHVEQEQQQRFVTDIAHELRTPLTILKSELEAIQDGLMLATPENLGQLEEQVDLLSRLVQDLRFLTLAEAGEMQFIKGKVDLNKLVTETLNAFTPQARAKNISLNAQVEPICLVADADRLRQALLNLLCNALRHSPDGSTVSIEAHVLNQQAILSVNDQGKGIDPEHLPHLFERFYRNDKSRSRDLGGSGLGLAIVKAIAKLSGGKVRAENAKEGGACFILELPLSQQSV